MNASGANRAGRLVKNARKRIKIDWRGKKKEKITKSVVLEINTGQKGLKVPDKKNCGDLPEWC